MYIFKLGSVFFRIFVGTSILYTYSTLPKYDPSIWQVIKLQMG